MPLLFSRLCDLFSDLEQIVQNDPPLVGKDVQQKVRHRILQWFGSLNFRDSAPDIDRAALLSAIFPKKRTDRVYHLRVDGLSRRLKRVLCLGRGRWELLDQWKKCGRGDLGDCVLRALRVAEHPLPCASRQVTVEEIDRVLAGIAKGVRFSAPKVRRANIERLDIDDGLQLIYRRLQSREAKWFTRMILQDYTPLDIPEAVVYRCIDNQLPMIMKMHDNFEDAIKLLESVSVSTDADAALRPRIGVKVGRPSYRPARGIKHAVQSIKGRKMSIERKYDGEYCQVHVDLRKPLNSFQLFSKSGKDSTVDRSGLHKTLTECLRIGTDECVISTKCILEGEMVVWSDREDKILDFCKIRKHISRTGSFLGTAVDSQPHPWEHLMIAFFDVLLLDDHSLLPLPHAARRKLLEQLVMPIKGRADIVMQRELDFSQPRAPRDLQEHFAQAIANRWEGLVVKPSDEPYFGPAKRMPNTYPSCWVKMKKDYITGFGDTADFAVVGAGYDVREASRRGDKRLDWTHFHIGCLKNKAAVIHLRAKPEYVVLDAVTQSISPKNMTYLNQHGRFRAVELGSPEINDLATFEMTSEMAAKMTVAFKEPFVFEVMGGGFDKPPNSEYLRLRWPRVLKIHQDRDWKDAITMDELQLMATEALAVPIEDDLLEEIETWQRRLDAADRGSRKVMLPWDDSQYEESDNDEEQSRVRSTPKRSSITRSTRQAPAPMVRMDSLEMSPGEQRLPNGEVTCRPASPGSISSALRGSSLPTPPTSSPHSKDSSLFSKNNGVFAQTPTTRRKRQSEVIVIDDESPPPPKRQRSEANRPTAPLQETSNASNRKRSSEQDQPASSKQLQQKTIKPEPFLVRKIPAMSDARFLPESRRKPWKPVIEPSSTAVETTVSANTTQFTHEPSHSAVEMSNENISARPDLQGHIHTETHIDEEPKPSEIPDFFSAPVMLSPCIKQNPQILTRIHGRIANILPLPTEPIPPTVPPTPPPTSPAFYSEIHLLVETKNEDVTGKVLQSFIPHIPRCGYTLLVWQWEILTLPQTHDSNPESDVNTPSPEKLFIGSMSYSSPHDEIVTRWRDGLETRVPASPLKLPNLHAHPIMLSPCISSNTRILENYITGQIPNKNIIPLPSSSPSINIPRPRSSSKEHNTVILLIDSKRQSGDSGKVMQPIVGWLPGSGYSRVEIWHWKVLRCVKDGGATQRRVEKCFYGSMRVCGGDGDGGGDGGVGEGVKGKKRGYGGEVGKGETMVMTVWMDGLVTLARVSKGGKARFVSKPKEE